MAEDKPSSRLQLTPAERRIVERRRQWAKTWHARYSRQIVLTVCMLSLIGASLCVFLGYVFVAEAKAQGVPLDESLSVRRLPRDGLSRERVDLLHMAVLLPSVVMALVDLAVVPFILHYGAAENRLVAKLGEHLDELGEV